MSSWIQDAVIEHDLIPEINDTEARSLSRLTGVRILVQEAVRLRFGDQQGTCGADSQRKYLEPCVTRLVTTANLTRKN